MTQRDLAIMLGKKESEVSRWFSGRFCISSATQNLIERVLKEQISSDSQYRREGCYLKIGVIGTGSIARRFMSEVSYVNGGEIVAAYNPDFIQLEKFCDEFNIDCRCDSICQLISLVDAVYIASPIDTHVGYARECLNSKKHVLCEMPFTETKDDAKELYKLAKRNNCILLPALKTAFCPSFLKIKEIVSMGMIGEVSDVSATVTTLLADNIGTSFYNERLLENATYPLLAIFKLLGLDIKNVRIFKKSRGAKILFCHVFLEYIDSVASFKIGVGVKSEGSLVISGTKGYVYVPAPWWKTEYFEVRYENQTYNKKFFFPYEDSGLRYEIQAFIDAINREYGITEYVTKNENLKILEIQNKILNYGK